MRVELIDRFTGRLRGTRRLDDRGIAVADRGARWVLGSWVVGEGGEPAHVHPADGEAFLRGVAYTLAGGTYSTAILVEGDEPLTNPERAARALAGYPVEQLEFDDDAPAADGLPAGWATITAGPRAGERLWIGPPGRRGAFPDLGSLPPQHPDDPSFLKPHVLPRRRTPPRGDPPERG